jgi:hypothetical protein
MVLVGWRDSELLGRGGSDGHRIFYSVAGHSIHVLYIYGDTKMHPGAFCIANALTLWLQLRN